MKSKIIIATITLVVLASATAGLAHSVFYYFPFYPLQTWTYFSDADHYHRHWANPGAPYDYYARYAANVRQTTAGSFDWIALQSGFGQDLAGVGWLGRTFIFGPNGEIYRTSAWYCLRTNIQVALWPDPFVWNPGYQGYWQQESGGGASCFASYATYDNMAAEAVR